MKELTPLDMFKFAGMITGAMFVACIILTLMYWAMWSFTWVNHT